MRFGTGREQDCLPARGVTHMVSSCMLCGQGRLSLLLAAACCIVLLCCPVSLAQESATRSRLVVNPPSGLGLEWGDAVEDIEKKSLVELRKPKYKDDRVLNTNFKFSEIYVLSYVAENYKDFCTEFTAYIFTGRGGRTLGTIVLRREKSSFKELDEIAGRLEREYGKPKIKNWNELCFLGIRKHRQYYWHRGRSSVRVDFSTCFGKSKLEIDYWGEKQK